MVDKPCTWQADGEAMLRKAVALCKDQDSCAGAHQTLAQSITQGGSPSKEAIAEAAKLYARGM